MKTCLILILIFNLTGCMVGPNYKRPHIVTPEAYEYAIKGATSDLNQAWWKQFEEPVLEKLIEEAINYNKTVQIALANIENALGLLIQTRAPLFPQIGYSAFGERQRLSQTTAIPLGPLTPNPQNLYQAQGVLNWQLDLFGKIRRLVEAKEANLCLSIDLVKETLLNLVATVANTYLQLRGLDEQLLISEKTLKTYGDSVLYFEAQYQHGQVSLMTVAQAKTQYEAAAAEIPKIQTQIIQTENALSVLLGKNPSHIPRGKSIYALTLPPVPSGIPSNILDQRPDLLAKEQKLIQANALIGAAKALYFPQISLTGAYGGASEELTQLFSGPSKTWNFTGSILGPIFTWGAIYGQVIQAEANYQAALLAYEEGIQKAFAEVENALSAHTLLIHQLAAETKLVQAAKDYTYLATLQYQGGYSPYFVVIQAQQQLFPAELNWAATQVQLLVSLVSIYQALGGGWVVQAENLRQSKAPLLP